MRKKYRAFTNLDFKRPIKPGPHHVELRNSSVTCSCGFSKGTCTWLEARLRGIAHTREAIPYISSITDRRVQTNG